VWIEVPTMSRDAAIGLLGRTPFTAGMVREVAVPAAARRLSTLPRIDYADAFLVEGGPAEIRTGEQWARAILEDAPIIVRSALRWGWLGLGVELGSTRSNRFVLGWEVRRSTPEFALLGATSRVGLSAELLFERRRQSLLFATFVQQENPIARAVWTGIGPGHRQVVRYVLEQGGHRVRQKEG
jgi:hypothetical protein